MGFKIMGVAFPQQFKTAEELAEYIRLGILEEIELTQFSNADSWQRMKSTSSDQAMEH